MEVRDVTHDIGGKNGIRFAALLCNRIGSFLIKKPTYRIDSIFACFFCNICRRLNSEVANVGLGKISKHDAIVASKLYDKRIFVMKIVFTNEIGKPFEMLSHVLWGT